MKSYCVFYGDQCAIRTPGGITWRPSEQWAPAPFSVQEVQRIKDEVLNRGGDPKQLKIKAAETEEAHQGSALQQEPAARNQPVEENRGAMMGKAIAGKAVDILTKPWQKAIAPYIAVLYVFLGIGVFFVALWNIGPYEVAARFIAQRFETSAIVGFLLALPLIGWLLSAIGYLFFWIVGAVVWAIIQLIELLPIVMTHNPGYVRSVLMEQEAHESLRPDQNDPGVVRYLKKFYNQFPMRFLVIARRLRVWVYVLDMLIVMMVYPPVREGGIGRFFFLLATGQWGQFDWVNIILMFVTLFAMEAVVKLLMSVKHFRDYLKATKRRPQAS